MSKNELTIFSESFGDKNNPAILLNGGSSNQATLWPDVFCKKLADLGYLVIRYDYRDSGFSSAIDFEKNPYSVMDLAKDAINILKKYNIQKANFVGFSMGGLLSQFIGAYFPEYAEKLILISTSSDFKVSFDAYFGKHTEGTLSPPDSHYISWLHRPVDYSKLTLEEKVKEHTAIWKILDGSPENYDVDFSNKQGEIYYSRNNNHENSYVSHSKAIARSFEEHRKTPELINLPTLIIQGGKDPIFPVDHGKDLANRIKNSKLLIWDEFAHAITPQHFDNLINTIDGFIKKK